MMLNLSDLPRKKEPVSWRQIGLLASHHLVPRGRVWRSDGVQFDPHKVRLQEALNKAEVLREVRLNKPNTFSEPAPALPEPVQAPAPSDTGAEAETEMDPPLLIYSRADGYEQCV